MSYKNILLSFILVLYSSISLGDTESEYSVEIIPPQNGVFYLSNGYQITIVELKDGNFRYWMSSDVGTWKSSEYPIKGTYKIENDTVTLISDVDLHSHSKWSFRQINNTKTIWANFAVDTYKESNQLHSYGILRYLEESAEDIWDR